MASITIKDREIQLIYTTYELKLIQEALGPAKGAITKILGRNPEDENDTSRYLGADHMDALGKAIAILGNAGLEEAGEEPNLTVKGVLRGLKQRDIPMAINAVMDAMADGMRSEIPEKEEDGPVDVTLEEIKKKDGAGD